MKNKRLVLLCLLSALAILAAGFALLFLSPAGVLQKNGPEEYMQALMESSTAADWEERIAPVWNRAVSEFEDREDIFRRSFEAAATGEFRFREYEPRFRRRNPVYILSAGERDLCLLHLSHGKEGWATERIEVPDDLLAAETRTVSITAPQGCEVRINGILLSDGYLAEDFIPYEDMQPLEGRYTTVPHRVRWEIPGLYDAPEVSVQLNGEELPLQSRSGETYRYLPPDARSYSFRFYAPADASVSINGAALTEADSSADLPLPLPHMNLSPEQRSALPTYRLYELNGLYASPEITVTAADGSTLRAESWEGETIYPALQSAAPEEELPTLVETYLTNYCHFGAHHYGYDMLLPYVVERGELWDFHINAQASLQWIIGEQLDIHRLEVFDWLPLGKDLCLCSAHISCTTTTAYETRDLELRYQLLCVRTEKGWRVQDMAYR